MNLDEIGYYLFMEEAEQNQKNMSHSTREQAIENCISRFRQLICRGLNPNDYVQQVLEEQGLHETILTQNEIQYIKQQVESW